MTSTIVYIVLGLLGAGYVALSDLTIREIRRAEKNGGLDWWWC